MADYAFKSISGALNAIAKREAARDSRVKDSLRKAAAATAPIVRRNMPRAFAELEDSLHIIDLLGQSQIIADAPHAAAVEKGTRPHMPPLEPLIAWVTLRGLHGLTNSGGVKSVRPGNLANPEQWAAKYSKQMKSAASFAIAKALRGKMGRKGAAEWKAHMGGLLAVSANPKANLGAAEADPAVVAIARAIQHKIAKQGTKPVRYMLKTVPDARDNLAHYVQEALKDR